MPGGSCVSGGSAAVAAPNTAPTLRDISQGQPSPFVLTNTRGAPGEALVCRSLRGMCSSPRVLLLPQAGEAAPKKVPEAPPIFPAPSRVSPDTACEKHSVKVAPQL